jgi:hypothetical protein
MPSIAGRLLAFGLARAACLMLAFGVLATPALANSGHEGPEYSLSIVEGESTQPEYGIVHTSAHVHPSSSVAVSIVRGGITVARATGNEGAWLSQVPQVGDVVTVESPLGNVVGSVVYDGLPSLDATVCAGSVNFSGQRSAGQIVEGGFYSLVLHTDPYGHSELRQTSSGQAQVTVLSGTAYAGAFLAPLAFGQTVWATESLQTPLAGGATFTYSSENDRPVGACPLPPVPPPAPPAPPALLGSLTRLLHTTIHKLLVSGWLNHVTINQPGTVVQDLFQQGGTLPAFAAAKHARRHKRRPPALLLARGSAKAAAAGTVSIVLHPTSAGRRKLKHAKRIKAVLVTTLISAGGAKLALEQRPVTLHN